MAFLTITKAAQVAGVSRGTIYNKIDEGELSRSSQGIDTAELLRVFGTLNDIASDDKAVKKKTVSDGGNVMTSSLLKQNDEFTRSLTDQLEAAERDKAHLRETLEKREAQMERAQERLDSLLDKQSKERQDWMDERKTWAAKMGEIQKLLPAPEDLVPRKKFLGIF